MFALLQGIEDELSLDRVQFLREALHELSFAGQAAAKAICFESFACATLEHEDADSKSPLP